MFVVMYFAAGDEDVLGESDDDQSNDHVHALWVCYV